MVDRITGTKVFGPLTNKATEVKAGQTKKSGSGSHTDRVDFSSALNNAEQTREATTVQNSARAEKIQDLKSQIENGTYQPDLDKVAGSLLPFLMQDS